MKCQVQPTSERGGRRVRGEGRTGRGRRKREKSEGEGKGGLERGKFISAPKPTTFLPAASIGCSLFNPGSPSRAVNKKVVIVAAYCPKSSKH